MEKKIFFKLLGIYLIAFAAVLLIPLALAAYYQFLVPPQLHPQPHSFLAFLETLFICLAAGAIFYWMGYGASVRFFRKEAIVFVVLIWFITPAFAALPFLFSGTLDNPFQAYFETTSGITTTGASVLHAKKFDATGEEIPYQSITGDAQKTTYTFYGNVSPVRDPETGTILYQGTEAVGKALLFWRSFFSWIGGGGIMVLFVAFLPFLGITGKFLFQAEIAGPTKETTVPRIQSAALQLWFIYVGLTVLETLILVFTNNQMSWFDAITISFATIATAGFSVKNTSIGAYDNPNTDWVIITFMILGAANFTIYYFLMRGRFYKIYDPELLVYLGVIFVGCALASWYLVGQPRVLLTGVEKGAYSVEEAVRYGSFQIVSAMTTTGFSTVNYDLWPYIIQALMLILMYVGGMSGSTAGGIKIIRDYTLIRILLFRIRLMVRPETVSHFKSAGQEVGLQAMNSVLCFFLIVILTSVAGIMVYIFNGVDPHTALGLIGGMVNNAGFAFRMTGPMESFAFLSDFGLLFSSFLMLLGRLEYLLVFAVLMPSFWKES